jgi:arsenite-transporting ATPase
LSDLGLLSLANVVDEVAGVGHGLVMVMGKGGVGKTTVAAAIAVGLASRGLPVHLTTTDPAAHLTETLASEVPGLRVTRIDPQVETRAYTERVLATRGQHLDENGRAMLAEDLRSPCTEEVAVFHAFSTVVAEARSGFVIVDTAPTGHTLLLLDAAGSFHREVVRNAERSPGARVVTPMMRLRDPAYSKLLLVTLPETTPVQEAAELQEDLRRAGLEPYAWVINSSLAATGTTDPVLASRSRAEVAQIRRVMEGLAERVVLIPWSVEPPVGIGPLRGLVQHPEPAAAAPSAGRG